MDRLEILKRALSDREEEVLNYQINIDNYSLAIAKIAEQHADKPGMSEFSANLSNLLESSKTEQLKAIIIKDVIADQLAELEAA